MKENKKYFEVGADGGSLTIYQMIDDENKNWYFHEVSDMGLEDEVNGVKYQSNYSLSFAEDFVKLLDKYPHLFNLYPLYADKDCVNVVLLFLKDYLKKNMPDYFNKHGWSEVLNVSVDEFDSK
jgi:hypothetical protein